MGAWGVKLYQDDEALDIKGIYKSELTKGKTNEEATKKVIEMFEINENEEEVQMFWCILADLQWDFGRLLPNVKEKALACIEKGGDLELWGEPDNKEYEARKKVLDELSEKLKSPQPPEKQIRIIKPFKTEWKNGDVFFYKIENDEKYKDKFIVLIKVCTIDFGDDKYPSFYIYNKIFANVPNLEELNNIKYLPQFYVPEAYTKKYKNLLYKYTMMLKLRERKINNLKYIGNISSFNLPTNEINDIKTNNNYYLGIIRDFEENQIKNYEAWLNIKY